MIICAKMETPWTQKIKNNNDDYCGEMSTGRAFFKSTLFWAISRDLLKVIFPQSTQLKNLKQSLQH